MPLWDGRAAERITAVLAGDGSLGPAKSAGHLAERRSKAGHGERLGP
jgi:hypothetical protein